MAVAMTSAAPGSEVRRQRMLIGGEWVDSLDGGFRHDVPERDGPLRLVIPDEKRQARWVRQVICSRPYGVRTSGRDESDSRGAWTVGPEHATLPEEGGSIVYRFHPHDLQHHGPPVRDPIHVHARIGFYSSPWCAGGAG
jgi:hypothetical protein